MREGRRFILGFLLLATLALLSLSNIPLAYADDADAVVEDASAGGEAVVDATGEVQVEEPETPTEDEDDGHFPPTRPSNYNVNIESPQHLPAILHLSKPFASRTHRTSPVASTYPVAQKILVISSFLCRPIAPNCIFISYQN